jgi:DNA (cytosine-5)-methyltransferase 1
MGDANGDRLRSSGWAEASIADQSSDWSVCEWLTCSDGKARPTQPSIKPVVDGLPKGLVRGGDRSMAPDADQSAEARVMRLRGYGNAIVPQLAAAFIRAFM